MTQQVFSSKIVAGPTFTVFPPNDETERTIVVLGVARGGTSMIAGLLRLFGVVMGENIDDSNNEDASFLAHKGNRELFSDPAKSKEREAYLAEVRKTIKQRDTKHERWGWKDPLSAHYAPDLLEELRNPHFICVFRDLIAVAGREMIEEQQFDTRALNRAGLFMNNAITEYQYMINFLLDHGFEKPALLVSYERTLRHPESVIDNIAGFAGINKNDISAENYAKMIEYISPDRGDGNINLENTSTSILVDPRASFAPVNKIIDRNAAFRAEVDKRLNVRKTGAHFKPLSPEDYNSETIKLIDEMNAGRLEEARTRGLQIVESYGMQHAVLKQHPSIALLDDISVGALGLGADIGVVLYCLGMVELQSSNSELAYYYFKLALVLLEPHADRDLPDLPYWSCLYHLGFASELIGNAFDAQRIYKRVSNAGFAQHETDLKFFTTLRDQAESFKKRAKQDLSRMGKT